MSAIDNCCSACGATIETINVPGPQGAAGADGTNGVDGGNAFTIVTDASLVPASAGDPITLEVASSAWMVVGQTIIVAGGSTYLITSIPDSTHVTADWLDYANDVAGGTVIPAGAGVSPSGTEPVVAAPTIVAPVTIYGSGTAYPLTTTPALLALGTVVPRITLTTAGVWLLQGRARIDYVGATFAANRTVSLKLYRTNNTPGDIANSLCGFVTQIITTLTYTAYIVEFPPVAYTTAVITDIIEAWGSIDVLPSAGTITAVEASITATYLNP